MSEPVVLKQRLNATPMRSQLVLFVPLIGVGWFLGNALAKLSETLRPVSWLLGLLLALLAAVGVWFLRIRQLDADAATGRLTISDEGLHGEHGGTVRTLAWRDITRLGPITHPASRMRPSRSIFGGVIAGGTNLAGRALTASSIGVIGPGRWSPGPRTTQGGYKLFSECRFHHGLDEATGWPLVPFWFADYEQDWEHGQLGAALRQHRPDLMATWENDAPRG